MTKTRVSWQRHAPPALDQFTPEFPAPIYLTTHPELGNEIGSGKDPATREFAMTMLPTVLDHL
jgi:hypothetical protein